MAKLISILIFVFIYSISLYGQDHRVIEQSYGFLGEGKGSFNKIIPYEDGHFLVVGEYNERAVIAVLASNGHLVKIFELDKYPHLRLTDVIAGDSGFIVSGICKECQRSDFSSAVVISINQTLTEIRNEIFLQAVNDNQVFNTITLSRSQPHIYAVFEGEIPGWGTRAHISKMTEENLTLQWTKQYNESFFSLPNFIYSTESTVTIGTQGFDVNFLIKADTAGNQISKYTLPQGKSVFVHVSEDEYGFAYLKGDQLVAGIIDETGHFSDSVIIHQGTNISANFSLAKTVNNKLLLASHSFLANDLPYISVKDRIYTFDIAPFMLDNYVDLPGNGVVLRNLNQILPATSDYDSYIIIGERISESRPFFVHRSAEEISVPEPPVWYSSSVCNDADLIGNKRQQWWPMTLPKITNDIVYATKINYKGLQEDLWFDYYRPYDHYAKKSNDKRPCLVYFSGGGYIFTSEDSGETLIHAAESGMMGVSVKYRVGVHPSFNGSLDSLINYLPYYTKTIYRALQDARDLLKYLYDHADELFIDRDNIFIMGHSAGGNLIYNYNHIKSGDFSPDLIVELGSLTPKTKIKGLIPYAAPLFPVKLDTIHVADYLRIEEDEPTFIIHGTCDSSAYYNQGSILIPDDQSSLGAYQIVCRKQQLNHPYRFLTIRGGGHDFSGFEHEIYPEIFEWIKDQVICGQTTQSCFVLEKETEEDCYLTDTCPDCFTSPVSNLLPESTYDIYPSVTDGFITVKSKDQLGHIEIFDIEGNIVTSEFIEGNVGVVDISGLNSGIYFVRKSKGNIIKKIIKL